MRGCRTVEKGGRGRFLRFGDHIPVVLPYSPLPNPERRAGACAMLVYAV